MRRLMLGSFGCVVPGVGGVDGGGVPGGCSVEVLKDVPFRELEGGGEDFEGGVSFEGGLRHCTSPVVVRVFIAVSGVRR
jgi:hypothetical protein